MHQLTISLRCNHWKIQNSGDFQDAINSIGLYAARLMDEAKPMTSVFDDVISLEAVRGGLNVPIEGHF